MDRRLENQPFSAQLRRVLNIMFPSRYIELYHKSPSAICSILDTRHWPLEKDSKLRVQHEASSDPASRTTITNLRKHLNASLSVHQAKPVGLCPIRRAIYDQCFDELIRQVTVGCIEQGLLLFRVRNEIRMTLTYYRKAYEAGVGYGLKKAIEAELKQESCRSKMLRMRSLQESSNNVQYLQDRSRETELSNQLELIERMKTHFQNETNKKDEIIKQQRAIIRALSLKVTEEIRSPI